MQILKEFQDEIIIEKEKKFNYTIMLFGAPGVGKQTYGDFLMNDFNAKAFSTGDFFRQIIKQRKKINKAERKGDMYKAYENELDPFQNKIYQRLKSG